MHSASLRIFSVNFSLQGKYYTIFEASAAPRVGFGVAANEVSESDEIILMQSPIRKAPRVKHWDLGIERGEETLILLGSILFHLLPSGKCLHNHEKSPFSMGKSTISMVIFNSYVSHYQRVVGLWRLWYGYYTLKVTGTQIFAWWIWNTGFPCGLTKSIQLPIDLSMAKYLPQIWLVNHYLVAHPT